MPNSNFNTDVRVGGGGSITVNELEVVDGSGNVVGVVNTTNVTASGDTVLGDATSDLLTVAGDSLHRGTLYQAQGAPTAETGAATITAADLESRIITITQSTGSDVALTVDTGTAMDTALTNAAIGDSFDWYVINLSAALADTATVTTASGHTLVGEMTVESAHADSEFQSSAHFTSRKTAANTWITYRLS